MNMSAIGSGYYRERVDSAKLTYWLLFTLLLTWRGELTSLRLRADLEHVHRIVSTALIFSRSSDQEGARVNRSLFSLGFPDRILHSFQKPLIRGFQLPHLDLPDSRRRTPGVSP